MMDWRLTNQKKYLNKVSLKITTFFKESGWDHEHCEFCWCKFLDGTKGYSTLDKNHWICEKCYYDFRDEFQWKIIE